MKHAQLKISIPTPCHEDWKEMTPTQKGKFCKVCTKEVFDFTTESDEQIVKHFQKNDNVCGRFHASQLNRKLIVDRKKRNHWLSYVASFLVPITLFSQEVKKYTNKTPKVEYTNASNFKSLHIDSLHTQGETVKISILTVTGTITDQNGLPLPGATIIIKDTHIGTTTDFDGNYKIDTKRNDVLVVSYTGYISVEIKVVNKNHDFSLKEDNSLGEVQILPYHSPKVGKVNIGASIVVDSEDLKIQKDSLTVSGLITDDTGLPLPGATVSVKNTKKGVTTDFDGKYKINMKRNDILVISYIGYASKEIKVTKNKHNVELESDGSLGEVVTLVGAISCDTNYSRPLTEEEKKNKKRVQNYFAFQKKKWREKREKRRAARAARRAEKTAKRIENKK